MGADLMIASVNMPVLNENRSFDEQEWYIAIRAYLATKSDKDIRDLCNDYYPYMDLEENYDVDDVIVTVLEDCLLTESRDKGFYIINGNWCLITGGMSWGDNPTESYESISLLNMLMSNEI